MSAIRNLFAAASVALGFAGSSCLSAEFLAFTPTPDAIFTPYAVSGNGQVLAGSYWVSEGYQVSAVWTAAGGVVPLWEPSASTPVASAYDLSYNGDVVVGYMSSPGVGQQAFRWTATTGAVAIPGTGIPGEEGSWTPTTATGVSADGETVAGNAGSGFPRDPFIWTSSTSASMLSGPAIGYSVSATGISADGTTIAGWTNETGLVQSYRWTAETGMVPLAIPGYADASVANGISADGKTVVGRMYMWEGTEAVMWTEDGTLVELGRFSDAPRDRNWSGSAWAASSDARFIVGSSLGAGRHGYFEDEGNYAFIWDAQNGLRKLEDMPGIGIWGTNGVRLETALAISDDGKVIVGTGRDSDGQTVGWMVVIPEPSVAMLSAFGLGLMGIGKRRVGRGRG